MISRESWRNEADSIIIETFFEVGYYMILLAS